MATKTYTRVTFADPYLACGQCGARVTHHFPDRPGPRWNEPCGHGAYLLSTCPSWGPVDGCRCIASLGARPDGHLPDPAPSVPVVPETGTDQP